MVYLLLGYIPAFGLVWKMYTFSWGAYLFLAQMEKVYRYLFLAFTLEQTIGPPGIYLPFHNLHSCFCTLWLYIYVVHSSSMLSVSSAPAVVVVHVKFLFFFGAAVVQ